jgi:MurNAc alpha-1-phosphate uridylyltransferase
MILAAGKGERMLPLTKSMPKPLLQAGGKALIEYHIESLSRAGITEIVINTAKFGDKIEAYLGKGDQWRVDIQYSHEGDEPQGTGGGVQKALPLIGRGPFVLINGDVWTDYNFQTLIRDYNSLIHLVMVKNPPQHLQGDFCLRHNRVRLTGGDRYTYSGIGVFSSEFFAHPGNSMFSFVPELRSAISRDQVSGELYSGQWDDIGTPERLDKLNARL